MGTSFIYIYLSNLSKLISIYLNLFKVLSLDLFKVLSLDLFKFISLHLFQLVYFDLFELINLYINLLLVK